MAILLLPLPGFSQNPADGAGLPDLGNSTVFITKKNVALFYEVLLAPLATWLKDGELVIAVAKQAGFTWQLTPDWLEGAKTNLGNFGFDEHENLIVNDATRVRPGYPFGDIQNENDPQRKAYKILWNVVYSTMQTKDLLYGINLFWIGAESVLRQSSGLLYRQSFITPEPLLGTAAGKENLVFSGPEDFLQKEVMRFTSPPVVFGYADITWRYRGEPEDRVWVYSPVVGRNREVFSSNRSDPLLQGILTLDDLMVWSAKVQSVNAKVVDEKTLLVPFPSRSIVRLHEELMVQNPSPEAITAGEDKTAAEEKVLGVTGLFQTSDGRTSTMLWNFDTKRFPQFAPWVPTEVVFVPRKVWILELSPRDPFYLDGRQILVVDQESMLPVYKVVYNRRGTYHRTVIGCWSLAGTEDGKTRFPFTAFVLAVEQGGKGAVAVSHSFVRIFNGQDGKVAEKTRALLDISNYVKKDEAAQSSQSSSQSSASMASNPPH